MSSSIGTFESDEVKPEFLVPSEERETLLLSADDGIALDELREILLESRADFSRIRDGVSISSSSTKSNFEGSLLRMLTELGEVKLLGMKDGEVAELLPALASEAEAWTNKSLKSAGFIPFSEKFDRKEVLFADCGVDTGGVPPTLFVTVIFFIPIRAKYRRIMI